MGAGAASPTAKAPRCHACDVRRAVGDMAMTDGPVDIVNGQDGAAAGGCHWAPALWEVAASEPDMAEVDAGWA